MFGRDPLADPQRLIRRVYAYVAYRLGDGPEAEDATSQTFERALRYRRTYDEARGEPVSWLLGIARNVIAERLSAPRLEPVEPPDVEARGDLEQEAVERLSLADALAQLDERERELIAARGATIVTNPVANMKLAVGASFDLQAARRHGIAVGLGTDGAGSNNSLDLLADAKQLALIQKHSAADAAVARADDVLAIARGTLAPLLGASTLQTGQPADFLLVRTDRPELGLGSLAAGLVYASSGSVVDTTVVGGRVLMHGGVIEGVGEIVDRARERAERIGLR